MKKLVIELWFDVKDIVNEDDIVANVKQGIQSVGYIVSNHGWEIGPDAPCVEHVDFESLTAVKRIIDEVFEEVEDRYDSEHTCSGYLWREAITAQNVTLAVDDFLRTFCNGNGHCTDCDFYDKLKEEFRGGLE